VDLPQQISINQISPTLLAQAQSQFATAYASSGSTATALAAVTLNNTVQNNLSSANGGPISSSQVPATTTYGQLLLPFPQYQNVTNEQTNQFHSNYNALQTKFEGRYGAAGTFLASYTWAKFISNTDSAALYLESNGATNNGGLESYPANSKGERSIAAGNIPNLLIVSYNLDLPFGKGRRYLNSLNPVVNAVVGGWGVNGITTIQSGFPLTFSTTPTPSQMSKLNITNVRPSVVPGCNPAVGGRPYSRISAWFNKSCFYVPSVGATVAANGVAIAPNTYALGNEPRVDRYMKQQGINNYDFALFKYTNVAEKMRVEFRAEFFNLFNTVRFAAPNTQAGASTFGQVTAQGNQPRLVQFGLRISR